MKKMAKWMSVALIAGMLMTGCATGAKGPTDEELLATLTQQCIDSAKAQDIEKTASYFSENFTNSQFGDKAGLVDFITNAKDMGYLENVEIDSSSSTTEIEGTNATIGPIMLSGSFGSTTINFAVTKEGDTWKITGMDLTM